MKKAIIKTIFFLLAVLFIVPNLVLAQTTSTNQPVDRDLSDAFGEPLKNVGKAASYNVDSPSLEGRISLLINFIFALLGVIFIIFIVYAGYLWATAAGNQDKVKKAKDNIYRSIIGLLIIFGAYAITRFIFIYVRGDSLKQTTEQNQNQTGNDFKTEDDILNGNY